MSVKPVLILASSLILAAGAGFATAVAVGGSSALTPQKTVMINLQNGPTGPAGPEGPAGPPGAQGPAGPAGSVDCPAGSTFGDLVINHPGGQVSIYTCIKD